jgi:hypothetical protein
MESMRGAQRSDKQAYVRVDQQAQATEIMRQGQYYFLEGNELSIRPVGISNASQSSTLVARMSLYWHTAPANGTGRVIFADHTSANDALDSHMQIDGQQLTLRAQQISKNKQQDVQLELLNGRFTGQAAVNQTVTEPLLFSIRVTGLPYSVDATELKRQFRVYGAVGASIGFRGEAVTEQDLVLQLQTFHSLVPGRPKDDISTIPNMKNRSGFHIYYETAQQTKVR